MARSFERGALPGAGEAQRNRLAGWSFAQLRQFMRYKAARKGIPVVANNPRDTSRACLECGLVDKRNRKTQAKFSCIGCGCEAAADFVGARNNRALGAEFLRRQGSFSALLV